MRVEFFLFDLLGWSFYFIESIDWIRNILGIFVNSVFKWKEDVLLIVICMEGRERVLDCFGCFNSLWWENRNSEGWRG